MGTAEIHSEKLRQLYAYRHSKISDGRLPSRASIDPAELPKLLPHIFLVGVERDPLRFRFRLIGTQVCSWAGRDMTGRYTDDPEYGPRGPIVSQQYAEVVAQRCPLYSEQPAARPDRGYIYYDRIVLPLASDGKAVDLLLCAVDQLAVADALRAGKFREIWLDNKVK